MKCDNKILVIQFHGILVHDSMLTPEYLIKISESLLNQKVKWNHQLEAQDHFHIQFQFQERDNLPKCQCDFQTLEFGQVSIGLLKLNFGFQNSMILGSNQ